jgi:hypothetical protein
MLGTPRIDEWRSQLVFYVQRLIIASVFVARKLGVTDLERPLRDFLSEFERATGTQPEASASAMLADYKKKHST